MYIVSHCMLNLIMRNGMKFECLSTDSTFINNLKESAIDTVSDILFDEKEIVFS